MDCERDSMPEGSVACGHNQCGVQTRSYGIFESEVKYFQHPVVLTKAPALSFPLSLCPSLHYDADVNGD